MNYQITWLESNCQNHWIGSLNTTPSRSLSWLVRPPILNIPKLPTPRQVSQSPVQAPTKPNCLTPAINFGGQILFRFCWNLSSEQPCVGRIWAPYGPCRWGTPSWTNLMADFMEQAGMLKFSGSQKCAAWFQSEGTENEFRKAEKLKNRRVYFLTFRFWTFWILSCLSSWTCAALFSSLGKLSHTDGYASGNLQQNKLKQIFRVCFERCRLCLPT